MLITVYAWTAPCVSRVQVARAILTIGNSHEMQTAFSKWDTSKPIRHDSSELSKRIDIVADQCNSSKE